MRGIALLVLVSFVAFALAENPGLVGGLKQPIVNKIKEKYFDTFMEGFRNIDIDEIKEGDLKVSGIEVEVVNEDHNNVQVTFNAEKNGVNVVVDNTSIKVHCNWKYKKLILEVSGVGDIEGPISHLSMMIGFENQEKDGMLIPKINIQDFDMGINSGDWHFHFDCSACPPGIADLLLDLFKSDLIKKIKDEAKSVVDNKVGDIVNEALMEQYPLQTAATDEISVSLATTGPVTVTEDFLHVPLDSTVFLTSQGYNRPFDAPVIPTEDPDNPGEIQLFASTYLYETFEQSINQVPMEFTTSIMGFQAIFKINGTACPFELKTQDKNLHAAFGGALSIPSLNIDVILAAEANIDFFFDNGDSTNMIYIDPDINTNSLKFTKLKMTIYGYTIDLTAFKILINVFIKGFINFYALQPIAIAKLEALPLTSTAAEVDFYENYTEAGVAFNFGLDN